jgi:hypothetical protein
MGTATTRRVRALERIVPKGCRRCRDRPTRLYLIGDEADPPLACSTCGRRVVVLVRRYVLVRDMGA